MSPTELTTDASPVGVAAVIRQQQSNGDWRPIAFASRALTSVEERYSQIERESLAILFGITSFKLYLYGSDFKVKTDHKPLVTLFSSSSKPPPRIERWITKLIPYSFQVQYQPGSLNAADYLSRSNSLPYASHHGAESHIHYLSGHATSKAIPLELIKQHTQTDKHLQQLIKALHNNSIQEGET